MHASYLKGRMPLPISDY